MTTRIRDQFITSIHALKNRPKMLRECIEAAGKWKKIGDLTAEEYEFIVEIGKKAHVLADVK